MITVPVVLGKLNSISKSDETLIRDSVKHTGLFRLKCPSCGAVGRCRRSGSYRRMMITVVANERREIELEVNSTKKIIFQNAIVQYNGSAFHHVDYPALPCFGFDQKTASSF